MAAIKILLMAPRSESTESLAGVLAGQSDMEVIEAQPARGIELLALLRRTEADVLVVESEKGGANSLSAQVLSEYPHLVIIAMNPDEQTVTLNRSTVESRTLLDSDLAGLANEVRVAVDL
jgi:hypothetical protein